MCLAVPGKVVEWPRLKGPRFSCGLGPPPRDIGRFSSAATCSVTNPAALFYRFAV